ncbi:chitinase CLP-like [Lolium perenne]|uniref:chitinase CLP-like n=1 Tax=Lolium perenne TaxID=4522 RepID=UPI0021EB2962
MALKLQTFLHLFVLSILLCTSSSDHSLAKALVAPPINALVAQITKAAETSLYTLSLSHKDYLLDLSGPLLWSPCSAGNPTVPCSAAECTATLGTHRYFAQGQCRCTARLKNPVTGDRAVVGDLTLVDVVTNATDGSTPTAEVTVGGVLSACAPAGFLGSSPLPAAVAGDAGLGRGCASLPAQLHSKLSLKRQFAVCLPSTVGRIGVAFFGDGPYGLMPPTPFDVSSVLSYTPLVRNPWNPSAYTIQLAGIAINQEAVQLPPGALDLVTLDTAAPYTVLRHDVYRAFVAAFQRATASVPRVPAVAPFEVCFNISDLGFSGVGYAVAPVDLVMARGGGNWTVFGFNSLAEVADDTACLAFVDGGWAAPSAVTVGGFQMENNFLVFDEAASRLGYSGALLLTRTACGNFNFARN